MSQEHPGSYERRVVVLGANGSETASVVSALFGQTGYETAKRTVDCVRTTGEVNGRKLTCIHTPGWWRNYSVVDTAEFIKRKLVLSVSECPPGPHAFLLVVRCDAPFGQQERRAVEEHVGLFGEHIWGHTIVVFTRGEHLRGKSIEQHIESRGEALKWLVNKCGNRCHMIQSFQKGSPNEVTQLLAKIDEVVVKSREPYFKCDDRKLQDVEDKRKADWDRAASRRLMVSNKRQTLNEQVVVYSAPELRILLLGWVLSGKTFARNIILGLKDIETKRTKQSNRKSGEVNGRQISVVDTPGWYKYFPAQCMPEWVNAEIQKGLTLDSKHPHAILLTIPVCTTFLEEQRKITEDNMKMFGEQVWRHTMVLFTCGDMLGETSIEEHIESEGEPLKWLVEKCGHRYHVLSWGDEVDEAVELLRKVDEMVAVNSLFYTESKGEKATVQEAVEEKEAAQKQDTEWEKMDKEMEEKIKNIWNQTTTNRRSKGCDVDFKDSPPSPDNVMEDIKSEKATGPLSLSELQSGNEDHEVQTSERHADQMERTRKLLERELARLDMSATERFQPLLST